MPTKKGLILCVDDEPNILRSLNWLLRKDFDVLTAPNGHEALALVRQNDFDVIISDQRMPGMTGVEFLREVSRVSPRAIRILLTGYSDLQAVMRAVNESEVFRFINKPWHTNELPKIVGEAVAIARSNTAISPLPLVTDDTQIATRPEVLLLIDDDPMVTDLLRIAIGPGTRILHARSLASAVDMLASEDVVVVVADTTVNHADTTRLLKVMKAKFPAIVSIVFAGAADAGDIVSLINQGQIYRYVPKPIKATILRQIVMSAILKSWQLRENPDYAKRHVVDQLNSNEKDALMAEIRSMALAAGGARRATTAQPVEEESVIHRVTMGLRRLFSV